MNEDKQMFQIGVWLVGVVLVLTAGLQVAYRTQNKALNHVNAQIRQTTQDIAVAKANFASYVRPEILRNMVVSIDPKAEVLGFHKIVAIGDLPQKQVQE